jgi:hypothetical protein
MFFHGYIVFYVSFMDLCGVYHVLVTPHGANLAKQLKAC